MKYIQASCLRLRLVTGMVAVIALLATGFWLRHFAYSSEPILYSYLQIVSSLLGFTYAANALVRFRGTHDRQTLIFAFGFVLSGLIETAGIFKFYKLVSSGSVAQLQVPLPWMVSRTLLALILIAALIVRRYVADSRDPGREIAIAFAVVVIVSYVTSAAYLGSAATLLIHPRAWIARPADLLPALLFAIAAVGFGRNIRQGASPVDKAFLIAIWMNVACHLIASQSGRLLDAPFILSQTLKGASYALVLSGALIENARLFDQVRQMAVTDPLTGLSNYRTLINVMESEIQRAHRTGRQFAILMLDLDGLKSINDRHGHLIGSRAICRLANVLRVHSRAMDTAARYGGDEFAVILPESGNDAAASVSQRICERLAADGEVPHVTVSVGVAVYPQDGETIDELFNTADRALYNMKGQAEEEVSSFADLATCS